MIRIVRKRTLVELREKADQLDQLVREQSAARAALDSMNRKQRRRAHRQLWSGLPE